MAAFVTSMIADPNALIQKEFSNFISGIVKTQRGMVLHNLVFEAHYPTHVIISLQQCAERVHAQGARNQKLRQVYIEIMSTNIWTASLLC